MMIPRNPCQRSLPTILITSAPSCDFKNSSSDRLRAISRILSLAAHHSSRVFVAQDKILSSWTSSNLVVPCIGELGSARPDGWLKELEDVINGFILPEVLSTMTNLHSITGSYLANVQLKMNQMHALVLVQNWRSFWLPL